MSKTKFKIINPYTEQIEKEFEYNSVEQVKAIIEKADKTFHDHWKGKEVSERAKYLAKTASLLASRKAEIAPLASKEMGKPVTSSEAELDYCIAILRYYAQHAVAFLADESVKEIEHGEATIVNEPLGVLLSVQPWNFPFSQLIRFAAPNIVAGNTIIMKPASSVYQCALAIQKAFDDAGLPDGVYNTFAIDTNQMEEIVSDDRIRGVMLTGSEKAGASIAALAGKYLKKSVLELGGSDPLIVLEHADLDKVVKGVLQGRFANSGQVCTSLKRIIAVESVHDKLVEKLMDAIPNINIGDPTQEDTEFGPMSSEQQMNTVLEQIEGCIRDGATLKIGGKRINRTGFFIEPTLFVDVTKGQVAYDEEIFGPVAAVIKVKDDSEAVRVANDSVYGLGGSVFCEDIDHAKKIARKIETGMVFINRHNTSHPALPFGGLKNSGYGRELSKLGLMEFVNKKMIRTTDIDADY